MINKLKKMTIRTVVIANALIIFFMLAVGYSDRIDPTVFPRLSNVGLTFPFFLIVNLGFMVFWIIFKLRMTWLPLLGFIICFVPIRKYCPLNISNDIPQGSIKILSYNVWVFAEGSTDDERDNPIAKYITEQNADIVCLQEAKPSDDNAKIIYPIIEKNYQYKDTMMHPNKGDCIALYSKYPIISREKIDYTSKGNISCAYKLKIGKDTVLLINNHLETTGLSPEDKTHFKKLVKGDLETDTAEKTSILLIDKLADATKKRAPEADAVAKYIRQHKGMPIIVCGDFNDSPISYVRRTIANELTDCYITTGNGPGISYHKSGFFVRIDNIMCSNHFEPYKCKVDDSIDNSDHYPIICWLKKR